jgi:prepilin-type N-terminal cleavage/methylation domain-containing protein
MRFQARGFTLIELLVVMAIMAGAGHVGTPEFCGGPAGENGSF